MAGGSDTTFLRDSLRDLRDRLADDRVASVVSEPAAEPAVEPSSETTAQTDVLDEAEPNATPRSSWRPIFDYRPRSPRKTALYDPAASVSYVMHPRRLLRWFAIGLIALCFAGLLQATVAVANDGSYSFSPARLFSLNHEANLLSWFDGVALFSCAVLLVLLAALAKSARDSLFGDWRLLAVMLLFLSMDEVGAIHQTLFEPLRRMSGTTGVFQLGWIGLSLLLFCAVGARFYPFLKCLPPATRSEFVVAIVVYSFGALGMGLTGVAYHDAPTAAGSYALLTLLDQFLEMLGALLLLRALLNHFADFAPRFILRVERPQASPEKARAAGGSA